MKICKGGYHYFNQCIHSKGVFRSVKFLLFYHFLASFYFLPPLISVIVFSELFFCVFSSWLFSCFYRLLIRWEAGRAHDVLISADNPTSPRLAYPCRSTDPTHWKDGVHALRFRAEENIHLTIQFRSHCTPCGFRDSWARSWGRTHSHIVAF